MKVLAPVSSPAVGLETTLLVHGVPREAAAPLATELAAIVEECGAHPAIVGVVNGQAIAGMNAATLEAMLASDDVPKVNTANLGIALSQGFTAATTVSTTMEICAAAGIQFFATGGIGGVHRGYGAHLDISADLMALARFPVAVISSGVKSLLDVVSTREALETLGVPVVGFQTDAFPAFYLPGSDAQVDIRMDDVASLAQFTREELARTGRGVLIVQAVPANEALDADTFGAWLREAESAAAEAGARGRDTTPAILGALHRISEGQTLRANLALIRENARLAARLAAAADPG